MRRLPLIALLTAVSALAQNANSTPDRQQTIVLPALKGLVFVPDAGMIVRNGLPPSGVVTKVDALGSPSFVKNMQRHIGQPLTLAGLDAITKEVVEFYTAQHRPLVNVMVPEQNVDSGAVQILVTEFRLGEVRTKGNRWFSDSLLKSDIRLKHGDAIDTQALLAQMDTVNANPFRKVNLIYQPSAHSGYTDLVLDTQDRLPLRVYSGFDNSGTSATGHDRWNFGVVWGHVLSSDAQVSYQLSSSSDLFTPTGHAAGEPGGWSFQGHSISWLMPFSWGDSLVLSGDYERSVPNVGLGLGMLGVSGGMGLRYVHNLPRTTRFTESLQTGYDFKSTNNNLDFGGTSVSANAVEVDQFSLAYAAGLTDRWGVSSTTATLTYSPAGLTSNNTTAAFQPGFNQSGRAFASARYIYFRADLNRLTRLPRNMTYCTRLLAQSTNSNLLYTEQLAGGGLEMLRGYSPFAALGDEGVLMSNEVRGPALRKFGEVPGLGGWQLLGFWDYGSLHAYQPAAGYANSVNASSAGLGVRYSLRSNVTAKMDYGWALRTIPGEQAGSSMASISVTVGN